MENKKTIWIVLGVVAVVVMAAAIVISRNNKITSASATYDTGTGQKGGFWNALFGNAAMGVDALGRNQTSTIASFWNGIIGIIATSKGGGKATFVPATYSDPGANEVYSTKQNYGPYIVGAVGFIALAVVAYSIFKN